MMKYLPFLLHDNLASLGDAEQTAVGRDFFLEQAAFPRSEKTVSAPPFIAATHHAAPTHLEAQTHSEHFDGRAVCSRYWAWPCSLAFFYSKNPTLTKPHQTV